MVICKPNLYRQSVFMANPFKKITSNAAGSKSKSGYENQRVETIVDTKTCQSSGTPRPKETNLVCGDYCKGNFMGQLSQFNPDS